MGKNILTAIMLGLTWALTLVGVAEARHEYIGNRHTAVMTERGVAREQRGGNIQERVAAIISDATEDTGQYSLLNSSVMRMLEVTATDGGGTLLFSDSPEYVKDNGILYQDTVSGNARILYYHLNDTLQPKKLAVVIEAVAGDAFVTVTRGGTSRPSHDYLKVGKATQLAYFNSEDRQEKILVTPEAPRLLQADMDKTVLHAGELVYGVYDFQATAPVKVSVIMYGANRNPFRFLKEATVLPRDEVALRGTFHGMNRIITAKKPYNPDRDGIVYFPIGDNIHDEYIWGVDATDGTKILNYGNYGILYEIAIPTAGRGETSYYLSPLGGVYAGVMRAVSRSAIQLWETPGHRAFFGDRTPPEAAAIAEARQAGIALLTSNTELATLGSYHGHQGVKFEYSPPGASNLPVNIILMPAE